MHVCYINDSDDDDGFLSSSFSQSFLKEYKKGIVSTNLHLAQGAGKLKGKQKMIPQTRGARQFYSSI